MTFYRVSFVTTLCLLASTPLCGYAATTTPVADLGKEAAPAATPQLTSQAEPSPTPTVQPAQSVQPTPRPGRTRKVRNQIEKYVHDLQLGVRGGYTDVFSAKARNQFNSSGYSVGPSFFRLHEPRHPRTLGPDYSYTYDSNNDNRVTLVNLGLEYRRYYHVVEPRRRAPNDTTPEPPRKRQTSFPYTGFNADLMFGKLHVPSEGIDTNIKFGVSGLLVAGYQYKSRVRAEATLTLMTSISGYNFSQFHFGINYKL